jgi:subtilisin family serine protease
MVKTSKKIFIIIITSFIGIILLFTIPIHMQVVSFQSSEEYNRYSQQNILYKNGLYGWPVTLIDADGIFPYKGATPLICIIDSGINHKNNFFNKKNIKQIILDSESQKSELSHGSQVAGLIISTGNGLNQPGGLLPKSKLLSIQSGNDNGMSVKQLAGSIKLAVDKGAKIINMSVSSLYPAHDLEDAVNYALSKKVILVAAAGNGDREYNYYPAAYSGVIAVSTLTKESELGCSTNFTTLNIAAPGEFLLTTSNHGSEFEWFSGSSSSAAIVSSACAFILQKHISMDSIEMKSLLYGSAKIIKKGSKQIHILDVKSALSKANMCN